jgi:tetratricopeptide (TPR) repeat protein
MQSSFRMLHAGFFMFYQFHITNKQSRNNSAMKKYLLCFIIFTLLLIQFIGGDETYADASSSSCVKFGFDWSSSWQWSQIEALPFQNPLTIADLQKLSKNLPLDLAHILFMNLAKLDNLSDVRLVPDRIGIDRVTSNLQHCQPILNQIQNMAPRNDLDSLISSAYELATIRSQCQNWFIPDVLNNPFPSVSLQKSPPNININLDFHTARYIITCLTSPNITDADWKKLLHDPVIQHLLEQRGKAQLNSAQLQEWLLRAANNDPLNRLYEWVYPQSYYDFGGVAVDYAIYSHLLDNLQAHAEEISSVAAHRLTVGIPADMNLKVNVQFLFAGDVDGWSTKNGLGIDLEHFGDNYLHLMSVISHECYHRAQNKAAIFRITLDKNDTDRAFFDMLLSSIWTEGTASWIGNTWPQSPSESQLDKDFAAFHSVFDTLYIQHDLPSYRNQIESGLKMAGLLYRIGWHMTQFLQEHKGKTALADSLVLGPAYFFDQYVRFQDKAPAALRFSPDEVSAIHRVYTGIHSRPILEAAKIMRSSNHQYQITLARAFAQSHPQSAENGLALTLLGDYLTRNNINTELGAKLLVSGIKGLGNNAGPLVRMEGELLAFQNKREAALKIFLAGAKYNTADPVSNYLVGECYRVMGKSIQALEWFKKALKLNGSYQPALQGISRLNQAELHSSSSNTQNHAD